MKKILELDEDQIEIIRTSVQSEQNKLAATISLMKKNLSEYERKYNSNEQLLKQLFEGKVENNPTSHSYKLERQSKGLFYYHKAKSISDFIDLPSSINTLIDKKYSSSWNYWQKISFI